MTTTFRKITEEELNALPRNEVRVAIMQDVIDQIEAERYLARTSSCYLRFRDGPGAHWSWEKAARLRAVSAAGPEVEAPRCEVCALGGIFLSSVRLFNRFSGDDPGAHDMRAHLSRWFTSQELHEIEYVFEGVGVERRYLQGVPQSEGDSRLLAIALSVIANDGEWRPRTL